MGEIKVSDRRRFFTALVAANAVFSAIAWTYIVYRAFEAHQNHYFVLFDNVLQALAIWLPAEVIIVIALVLIAYPMEAWLGKRGAYFPTLGYLGLFGAMALIGLVAQQWNVPHIGFELIFLIIGLYAGVVAVPARLLYPLLLKSKLATRILAGILVGVALIGVGYSLTPHSNPWAASKYDLFPNRTDGELARETFLNGAPATIPQMKPYEPAQKSAVGQNYDLVISCSESSKSAATFKAVVTNSATGEVLKTEQLYCPRARSGYSSATSSITPLDFGNQQVDPELKLVLRGNTTGSHLPMAFAVVAKSGLPW